MVKIKLLLCHNTIKPYRVPFFNCLNEKYDFKIIFKRINGSKNITSNLNQISNIDYTVLSHIRQFKLIYEIIKNDFDIIIDSLEYDILLTYLLSKIKGKPLIVWSEEWGWGKKTLRRRVSLFIIRYISNRADALLVPGTKHKEYFISLGNKNEKIFIMPNVSNISFKKEYVKESKKLEKRFNLKNKKVILYVGRLIRRKGVHVLLKAFSYFEDNDDILLMIVGEGKSEQNLKSITKQLNIHENVYFFGYVENKDLPPFYLISDLCVVPSVRYRMQDPWVFVVNESMYFNRPIVATNAVGAAFDMIEDGRNGYVVKENQVIDLYLAIKKILNDEKLAKKMGTYSKMIINKNYRYSNMMESFNNAVDYVLSDEND